MKKLEDYNAGNYIKIDDYKSFIPSKINEDWIWNDSSLNKLLADANLQLGKLNGFAQQIPNIDIYIKMHVKVEANKSSKIEGTKTTIDEDLLDMLDVDPEKRDDWQEVQNYVKALDYGIERINDLPICTRLIKEVHGILMHGVRGKHKNPGEYRTSQNWIGGTRPDSAVYVPPIPSEVGNCLSDMEKFINNEEINTPDLIKIAMVHYQFESIHPFLDGNRKNRKNYNTAISVKQEANRQAIFLYIRLHRKKQRRILRFSKQSKNTQRYDIMDKIFPRSNNRNS